MANEAEMLVIRIKLLGQKEFAAGTAAARAEISSVARESAVTSSRLKHASFNAGLLGAGFHKMARGARAAGLGLIAAGIAGGVAGIHFEQEMGKVGSVVRLTGRDYKLLSQMALDESTKTRFSATQAAEAMYMLGRAGFSTQQIMRALPGTLALAHASGIDLASAARIQTEALRGFNLEAGDSGRVADVLARATRGGNLTMQDLQYTIKYVGSASFTTGQKMEDMVGLIEAMARHGVRGTQAGTSLRTMLTRLIDPVKQTKDGLAMLGIKASDLYGPKGLKPLPEILETIRAKMKTLDPVSANRAVHKISGQWAFTGINTILNTDPKIVKGFITHLNNAKGTAKDMADILNNTVQMQLLRMWHTLEAIGIGIYMMFRIPFKNALKEVNAWLQPFVLQMQILGMFIKQGDWEFLVTYLDNMTHSGGNLSKVIWFLVDALKVTWNFIKLVVLPVAKQWAIILGAALFIALKGIIAIMRVANHHARVAKFLLGLLILAYIHWKVYTLAVTAVLKIQAFWEAITLFRTRMLRVATIAWTAVTKIAVVAQWAMVGVMWALNLALDANPIVLIVVGLVLLGIALYMAYKHVKWFHELVDRVFNWIWDHWPLLAGILFGPFGLAVGLIIDNWRTLYNFFKNAPGRLASAAGDMWKWLKQSFISAINWIIGKWNSVAHLFAFSTPNVPGTNWGGIDYGGLPTISPIATGNNTTAPVTRSQTNLFPPKVLDPKGPGNPKDPSKNPLINPTISVQIDGKEVAKAVHKHNSDRKARH